jgi:hypothetical protein
MNDDGKSCVVLILICLKLCNFYTSYLPCDGQTFSRLARVMKRTMNLSIILLSRHFMLTNYFLGYTNVLKIDLKMSWKVHKGLYLFYYMVYFWIMDEWKVLSCFSQFFMNYSQFSQVQFSMRKSTWKTFFDTKNIPYLDSKIIHFYKLL